jgi:hypothetical protein
MPTRSVGTQFTVETEYNVCGAVLVHAEIITALPSTGGPGVIGIDGKEYPWPTQEQVEDLFAANRELVGRKLSQGFDRLEIIPLAMPVSVLIDRLNAAIVKRAADGEIYQTRHSHLDPRMPIRVNAAKQAWVWETLRQALDTDELVYFPQDYVGDHGGQTKQDAIRNRQICGVPGWSVGLVESFPMMPGPGQGETIGGRKQLEIGLSPREYLKILQAEPYQGETGKTLEDFLVGFLTRLEILGEVSHDVSDNNALWCLGQYLRVPYAELVPTGRWFREVGRVRLDMHRTGNKKCTKSWGASTTVRLGTR